MSAATTQTPVRQLKEERSGTPTWARCSLVCSWRPPSVRRRGILRDVFVPCLTRRAHCAVRSAVPLLVAVRVHVLLHDLGGGAVLDLLHYAVDAEWSVVMRACWKPWQTRSRALWLFIPMVVGAPKIYNG